MKKIYAFVCLFAFSANAQAAGPFDGIYMLSSPIGLAYATIHENSTNNQIIAVYVDTDPDMTFSALSGTRVGNSVTLTTITGASAIDTRTVIHVDFTDDINHPLLTVLSCTDGFFYYCLFPAGYSLTAVRIF